jgi:hypothetical protein
MGPKAMSGEAAYIIDKKKLDDGSNGNVFKAVKKYNN